MLIAHVSFCTLALPLNPRLLTLLFILGSIFLTPSHLSGKHIPSDIPPTYSLPADGCTSIHIIPTSVRPSLSQYALVQSCSYSFMTMNGTAHLHAVCLPSRPRLFIGHPLALLDVTLRLARLSHPEKTWAHPV